MAARARKKIRVVFSNCSKMADHQYIMVTDGQFFERSFVAIDIEKPRTLDGIRLVCKCLGIQMEVENP